MLILQLKNNVTRTEIAIHSKNNGLHIEIPLIFWFLIMILYSCFYHQLWVKWIFIHIRNSFGYIGQTHSRFPKCLWMFDTEWNAHQIDILDYFYDNSNLTNKSSTPLPEWKKKTVLYIAHLIILCTSIETSIY